MHLLARIEERNSLRIKKAWRNIKVGWRSGRAFYRFAQRRYFETSAILETVVNLCDEDDPDTKHIRSVLGRAYLYQGRNEEAFKELEKAFKQYAVVPRDRWREQDESGFKETAEAFAQLLRQLGNNELALKVEQAPSEITS